MKRNALINPERFALNKTEQNKEKKCQTFRDHKDTLKKKHNDGGISVDAQR